MDEKGRLVITTGVVVKGDMLGALGSRAVLGG